VPATYDLVIIGGGINGCGIPRDAAGRGLAVHLCDGRSCGRHLVALDRADPWRPALSRAHDFRLAREALRERQVLWRIAPHIVRPLRFVLPHRPGLRTACLLRLPVCSTRWAVRLAASRCMDQGEWRCGGRSLSQANTLPAHRLAHTWCRSISTPTSPPRSTKLSPPPRARTSRRPRIRC
jgi:hypothetical protein